MLPDNRIRYPSTRIDFDADVGVTGQAHDDYPSAGGQSRYDHMRMSIIGLLSQQSSFEEPTQYRDGTPWFDLNTMTLKISIDGEWVPYSQAVPVAETDDGWLSLADWYSSVAETLASAAPEIVFSGQSNNDAIDIIPIPTALRDHLQSDSRPFVYKNGLLISPQTTQLNPGSNPTSVRLLSDTLDDGDSFTIVIKRIPSTTFYTTTVTV